LPSLRVGLIYGCFGIVCMLCPIAAKAQSPVIRLEGDQLRVAASGLHILGSETLQRLHNGIAMNLVFSLGIGPGRNSKPATAETFSFVVSYDIFEEKFAVSRISPNPRSVTHLSESAVQTWCLDSIALPLLNMGQDQPFWVTFEYHIEEPRPVDSESSSGSLIGQLVDIFSRKSQKQESSASFVLGPFRISELRRQR
jgi:hypothetical protein